MTGHKVGDKKKNGYGKSKQIGKILGEKNNKRDIHSTKYTFNKTWSDPHSTY